MAYFRTRFGLSADDSFTAVNCIFENNNISMHFRNILYNTLHKSSSVISKRRKFNSFKSWTSTFPTFQLQTYKNAVQSVTHVLNVSINLLLNVLKLLDNEREFSNKRIFIIYCSLACSFLYKQCNILIYVVLTMFILCFSIHFSLHIGNLVLETDVDLNLLMRSATSTAMPQCVILYQNYAFFPFHLYKYFHKPPSK